jgi:tetratricopeptide (TPR) repeat protein
MIHNNLGAGYESLGRLDEAVSEYEQAVMGNPDDPLIRHALGMAYQRTGMVPEATIEIQEAVKLGQNEVFLYIDLARILWGQGRYKEAQWYALEASHIDPDDPWSYAILGWVAKAQGDAPESARLASLAYQKQSDRILHTAADFREAGALYFFIDRLEDADINFKKALKLGLNEFDMFTEMGWICVQRREWQAAVGAFQRAVELRPGDYYAHNELADSLRKVGRIEDSISEYKNSIALSAGNYRAHYCLWEIYYQQGALSEAIAELEIAVSLPIPDRIAPLLWKTLGIANEQAARIDKAMIAYRQAAELDPEDAGSRYLLASLYKDQGDVSNAMQEARITIALAEAIDDRDTLSLVHCLMAELYEIQGDLNNAVNEQRIAVLNTQSPTDKALCLWELGILLGKSSRGDEAIAAFDQAIQLNAQNPYYYYSRSLIYASKGDSLQAMDDIKKAQGLAEEQGNQELMRSIDSTIEQYK